jgi:secreted trypsin-like serine protease
MRSCAPRNLDEMPARVPSPARALATAAVVVGLACTASAAAARVPWAHAAIVGGAAAPAGSFPWLAYVYDDLGVAAEACTGTVVAPNLVLTAAHCVENISSGATDPASGFTVITGSLDWSDTALRQISGVTEVIPDTTDVEANATGVNVVGDAALLELATPTTAPPIALANSSDLALVQPGTAAAIAGWGLTGAAALVAPTDLQAATTVVQATDLCTSDIPDFDPSAQLCTIASPSNAVSFCNGDSGGPLIAASPASAWIEIGIASTSFSCDPQLPDIFTRVDAVYAWAQSWINALPSPIQPTAMTSVSGAGAPAQPELGSYVGRSSQRSGHLDLTVAPSGVAQLKLEFDLRCPHGIRGPLVEADSGQLELQGLEGSWGFSTAFRNAKGWRYSITGSLSAFGTATGSLAVETRNAACRSGVVHWTASIPTG